ncbi:hypothetical protein SERLA73DRAFT_182180 [Serpula lacrymans var. lacrymans S7.3]|uniref:Methyltransferase domain-containing protein n=2 Tax=Serpula lacrymans var. lacrymans TaxID=341189 RepID=F8PWT7_SERL3|nr:uncharacterized protein SERLADRAFT_468707 [Serpula lacrymans var. lacrymans S7.9]EGN99264.1 hypothetical protein SERLA73DRAFT_182180 [Serpula lacrymans var. lacrymans S7.3]EGO24828.1 hypothetical protein SERLADRAFT_468707 [Serpula lacrymans var. lacrymans S7.9]
MTDNQTYVHGHHESALRAHSWRTVANSAAYLQGSLKPDMKILDIGCGPGTITADLARLVPQGHVTGIEPVPDILNKARETAAEFGVSNVDFAVGDIHALDYPDDTFDVVHAHQVLQHIPHPVKALREMRRVTKPGGLVAARETDFKAMTWYPEVEGMGDFFTLYEKVARSLGGEPNAGRRVLSWALEAGYDRSSITCTAGTWCYATPKERAWWGGLWAERVVSSSFAKHAVNGGFATEADLEKYSKVWQEWSGKEDGWFALLHGELLCQV